MSHDIAWRKNKDLVEKREPWEDNCVVPASRPPPLDGDSELPGYMQNITTRFTVARMSLDVFRRLC